MLRSPVGSQDAAEAAGQEKERIGLLSFWKWVVMFYQLYKSTSDKIKVNSFYSITTPKELGDIIGMCVHAKLYLVFISTK